MYSLAFAPPPLLSQSYAHDSSSRARTYTLISSAHTGASRRALLRLVATTAAATALQSLTAPSVAAETDAADRYPLAYRALPCPPGQPTCRPVEVMDLRPGTGRPVTPGSTVTLRWTGRLADRYGWPIQKEDADEVSLVVGRGELIEGFEMGLDGMREGGKRRIIIPAELGYKDERKGPLPQRYGDRRRLFATVLNERRYKKAGDLVIDVLLRRIPCPHTSLMAHPSKLAAAPAVSHRGLRLALAGALAGMFTNTILHPLDTVKTLRQTDPASYRGVAPAIVTIIQSRGPLALYAGIAPALLGSALSSALYFGVYELAKTHISSIVPSALQKRRSRVPLTAISAACGNVASSILFVPKEVVKQRMQAGLHSGRFFSAAAAVVRTSGMQGLYRGYKATLLRNIPSTMIRFALYEEFKLLATMAKRGDPLKPREYVAAGALAGVLSSTCTTPMDVIKTRLATGLIDPRAGIVGALKDIVRKDGVPGLFVGLRPRLMWSTLFAAVGFSTYELCKAWALNMRTGVRGWGTGAEESERKVARERKSGRGGAGAIVVMGRGSRRCGAVCARRGGRGEFVGHTIRIL